MPPAPACCVDFAPPPPSLLTPPLPLVPPVFALVPPVFETHDCSLASQLVNGSSEQAESQAPKAGNITQKSD
jgi:hypothetical protein